MFSFDVATSHFHRSSDSFLIYIKKPTFQASLILELFARDFRFLDLFRLNCCDADVNMA